VIDPLEVINGCTLQSLIDKIDDGNLPEKEVYILLCHVPVFLLIAVAIGEKK
jgi:hypothetical protein